MVVRGPKPTLPSPRLRGWQPTPPTAVSLWALGCRRAPRHLPNVTGTAGACSGEGGFSDPLGPISSSATRLYAGCACMRVCVHGGQAGGWKWSPGRGGRGGFSIFLYLYNQREEKFLWLFLRMVCSQDLEHCLTNIPLPASLGVPGTVNLVGRRDSARQPSWLCQHCSIPTPLQGSWPHCPPCPPTVQLHTCLSAILLLWHPSAPCSCAGPAARSHSALPWDPPWGCPPFLSQDCAPVRAQMSGAANSALGTCWGRKQALLFCPVLYQNGPTPISAGFLLSANERYVFTHYMLCSLTCVLQSKPPLVRGSRQGAG